MTKLIDLWWKLVSFGFRLLYRELAFTYDAVSWAVSLGSWRSWQRCALQHLPPPEAGCVLELAHGTGHLQVELRQLGYQAIGLDASRAMGRLAGAALQRAGMQPALFRARAQCLPLSSASFAAVLATFPTDFIAQGTTLQEVSRVLRPGGIFVIIPSAELKKTGIMSRFLEWLYRVTGQRGGDLQGFVGRIHEYGFSAELIIHEQNTSRVFVVVAQKR